MGAMHLERYSVNVQQMADVIVNYSSMVPILKITSSSFRELHTLRSGLLQLQAINILGQAILCLVHYRTFNNISISTQ